MYFANWRALLSAIEVGSTMNNDDGRSEFLIPVVTAAGVKYRRHEFQIDRMIRRRAITMRQRAETNNGQSSANQASPSPLSARHPGRQHWPISQDCPGVEPSHRSPPQKSRNVLVKVIGRPGTIDKSRHEPPTDLEVVDASTFPSGYSRSSCRVFRDDE